MNIAIVGCGYWGPNYVRICNNLSSCTVTHCCDMEPERLEKMRPLCAEATFADDYHAIADDPGVGAAIVTTPLPSHYEITKALLESGKHVLVEKPFVATADEARELTALARTKDRVLMVGHVYEHNPGIEYVRSLVAGGKLGTLYYVSAVRAGLGPIRKHASALWDLATHDISIALHLCDSLPRDVVAVAGAYIQQGLADVVFVSLSFPSGIIYNIHASWLAPEKVRQTVFVGSEGMAVFDDVNKSEMVRVYDRSIIPEELDSTPGYSDHQRVVRVGDVHIPRIDPAEPLRKQVEVFLERAAAGTAWTSDRAVDVVKVLAAAEESLTRGKAVQCR